MDLALRVAVPMAPICNRRMCALPVMLRLKPLSFPLTPISLSLASRSFVSLLLGVDRY